MGKNLTDRLISSLHYASKYDSGNLVKPQVILWPDPERQWVQIISMLQEQMPELLVFGNYKPEEKTGPALWLKCMVAKVLPEADWSEELIPIIYLPGISKNELKNLSDADPKIAPLLEYQYSGTIWTHPNGKEWTAIAFMQNSDEGLGLKMAQDKATKETAIKVLQNIFEEREMEYPSFIDSSFFFQLTFPNAPQSVLSWMCKGEEFLNTLDKERRQIFEDICESIYKFKPDYKNIRGIVEKLGNRKGSWEILWRNYFEAPRKYPEIEDLLRISKPEDLGTGMFESPIDSWPQINEDEEEKLRQALEGLGKLSHQSAIEKIGKLEYLNKERRFWVWAELGKANLAIALKQLSIICQLVEQPYGRKSIDGIKNYYLEYGHTIDFAALQALASVKSEKEKSAIKAALQVIYKPWLEKLANDLQNCIKEDASVFIDQTIESNQDEFYLFVDAFRLDIAKFWAEKIQRKGFSLTFDITWTLLPSVTPTAKPYISPIAERISLESDSTNFTPQTVEGKELSTHQFEVEMKSMGYEVVKNLKDISVDKKYWMEIGKIDKVGHEEQSGLANRIFDLLDLINEKVTDIFKLGFNTIKIVTDHGWLLVPGGMPKENLPKDHIETRWGRCAILKEGVPSGLLHLPWAWNKSVMVAYAPGISFFKQNQEYAHGGISIQECLVPVITVEHKTSLYQKIIIRYKWVGLKCNIEVSGSKEDDLIEIRTKYSDPGSGISKGKSLSNEGKAVLFIEDTSFENTAAFIVITDKDGTILEKIQTIIGE